MGAALAGRMGAALAGEDGGGAGGGRWGRRWRGLARNDGRVGEGEMHGADNCQVGRADGSAVPFVEIGRTGESVLRREEGGERVSRELKELVAGPDGERASGGHTALRAYQCKTKCNEHATVVHQKQGAKVSARAIAFAIEVTPVVHAHSPKASARGEAVVWHRGLQLCLQEWELLKVACHRRGGAEADPQPVADATGHVVSCLGRAQLCRVLEGTAMMEVAKPPRLPIPMRLLT